MVHEAGRVRACALALLIAVTTRSTADAGAPVGEVKVVGTQFIITLPNGEQLSGDQLVGLVLTLGDPSGARRQIRVDAAQRDHRDPIGEIALCKFAVRNPDSGGWENLCPPDAEGLTMGFPLSGTWTPSGEHLPSNQAFSITCTGGVNAKCVRMGYKFWKTSEDGTPRWDVYQACTRMLHADYCGDGRPHTRDGALVDVYDMLGIQSPQAQSGLTFEAAWTAAGAVCVRKVRIPELATLDDIVLACPTRLTGNVGMQCDEEREVEQRALIFNRS